METRLLLSLLSFIVATVAFRLSLALTASNSSVCLPQDRQALLNFKRLAIVEDPASFWLSNWSTAHDDCCLWNGVSCDDQGFVTSISLHNCGDDPYDQAVLLRQHQNALRAELTPEAADALSAMARLSVLDFGCHLFRGSIPPNIANLTSLTYLDLSFQSQQRYSPDILTGHLPDQLWSLPSLRYLDVGYNSLTGPLSPLIGNASSLTDLHVGTNNFTGAVPDSLANLNFLQHLDFSSNVGLDSLPHFLEPWAPHFQLQTLDMSLCSFNGTFPSWLRFQTNLSLLTLAGNQFTDEIPHWAWQLASDSLDLSGNNFSYTFSTSTCSSASGFFPPLSLAILDVSYNGHIRGIFPCFIANLTSLEILSLAGNAISGSIPDDAFRNHSRLNFLDLSENLFDGLLPTSLQYLSSLENVDLDSNPFLPQEIPHFLLQIPSLKRINLCFCKFTAISLIENNTINPYSNSSLEYLKLTGNRLSGAVLEQLSSFFPKLKYLRLDDNLLTGQVPESLSRLSQLETLDLSGNDLQGPLPESFSNLTNLVVLNLNQNSIGGSVPSFIRSLDKLLLLDLGSNELGGAIPDWLASSLPQLQILSFTGNNLTGSIPASLGRLKGMIHPDSGSSAQAVEDHDDYIVDDVNITLKGHRDAYGFLQYFTLLDLSHNQLSGPIPSELGESISLVSLDVSSNRLTGVIPAQLGQLEELESLDLSVNNLQGQIPQSFNNLQKLSFVNVSSNHLHGPIPTATQWYTFNTSSFQDNGDQLCVESPDFLAKLPLCSNLSSQSSSSEGEAEDDSEVGRIELWVGFGAGFGGGMVLGLVVVVVCVVCSRGRNEESMVMAVKGEAAIGVEGDDGGRRWKGEWAEIIAEIEKEMSLSGHGGSRSMASSGSLIS